MKGLDAPTMIAIIIAVIAGILILYFLWSKGLIPFFGGASESECKNNLIRACNNQLEWDKINEFCTNYFKASEKKNLKDCLTDPVSNTVACTDFCGSFLGG